MTGALKSKLKSLGNCDVLYRCVFAVGGMENMEWLVVLLALSGERSSQPLKVTYTKVPCISKTPTAHVIEC